VMSAQPTTTSATQAERRHTGGNEMANIGKSISIKGDVIGDEDTILEGRVEGRVSLRNFHLTIGPNGDIQGEVSAKMLTVVRKTAGSALGGARTEGRETGRIQGARIAPRLTVAGGGVINGAITMKEGAAIEKQQAKASEKIEQKKFEPAPPPLSVSASKSA